MGTGANTKMKLTHTCSRKFGFADFPSSGTTVKMGAIPKGSRILGTTAFLVTAFVQTSASFLVGSSGDDDMLATAGDIGDLTAAIYGPILTTRCVLTSDLDVYAKMTYATALTAGEIHVVIEYDPPVNLEDMPTQFDT